MRKLIKLLHCFVFLVFCLLISCKKSDITTKDDLQGDNNSSNTPQGILKFHLHTYIGESEVDAYDITYLDEQGRKIAISLAQLYISDIQLVRLDDSFFTVPDKAILKFFESDTSPVGQVPVGNYKSIRFKVGINSFSGADSLIFKEPSMWFSNQAKPNEYVYFNFQGKIDTTSNLGGLMAPFCYKIGANSSLIEVNMPIKNFTVLKDQIQYLHMIIDYSKIFNGIELNNPSSLSVNSVDDNSLELADKLKNNIPLMFKYE
jgi:hypothetical protein